MRWSWLLVFVFFLTDVIVIFGGFLTVVCGKFRKQVALPHEIVEFLVPAFGDGGAFFGQCPTGVEGERESFEVGAFHAADFFEGFHGRMFLCLSSCGVISRPVVRASAAARVSYIPR